MPAGHDDKQVMDRLIVGKVDMNPQPISGQQVGHTRNAQCPAGASDFHFYLWPGQIEGTIRPPRNLSAQLPGCKSPEPNRKTPAWN